ELVLDLLAKRGIPYGKLSPGGYGTKLHARTRPNDPERAVDRMLIAGLIEARSCERFDLLAKHVEDQELATFYRSLFESEARHHSTYVRLAKHFASEDEVHTRLRELAAAEAAIVAEGDPLPRMHS
ncbi:MAG TPA: tRNA isopentenyl-2-thiomethyl-A-37 hydroxylase MiaE, partial [Verrucomicrobiae bacterium]|nr:tRNA isopentenyl-2-thiomethyl-A-37 hydroxylase MiaE [Verrucomicrobiae bacterium]